MKRLLLFVLFLVVACTTTTLDPCDLDGDGETSFIEQKQCSNQDKNNVLDEPSSRPNNSESDLTGSEYELMPATSQDLGLPIYLTTMTHMEGGWTDDVNEALFMKHAEQARFFMNLALEYDAKITVESELPFALANVNWEDNVMLDLYENGMGVGTHCDIGAMDKGMTQEEFTDLLRVKKQAVDALVGSDNNWGCSGAGTHLDWSQGLQDAGFTYVNGIVGFHLQAIPEEYRPEGYTDTAILKEGHFHDHIPSDLYDRMYLRYLENTDDLMPDTSGIVMSAGSMGKLSAVSDSGYEAGTHVSDAELDFDDVDLFVELLYELNENRDMGYISKVDLYFPANELVDSNEEVLRYFFEQVQVLQNDGVIQWATQKEVVEQFIFYN